MYPGEVVSLLSVLPEECVEASPRRGVVGVAVTQVPLPFKNVFISQGGSNPGAVSHKKCIY